MGNTLEQIELYKEKILQEQFNISECIEHKLTKGEIREDFIRKIIENDIKNIKLCKGIIATNNFQSPQADLIIPTETAILNNIGEQNIIDVVDVKYLFEIKSNLKIIYIKKVNDTLKLLKQKNPNMRGGIICYKVDCLEKNILKHFGYDYDIELDSFQKNNNEIGDEFKDIDYVISFDKEKEFILTKDISGDFILNKKIPIYNMFLRIFLNLGGKNE